MWAVCPPHLERAGSWLEYHSLTIRTTITITSLQTSHSRRPTWLLYNYICTNSQKVMMRPLLHYNTSSHQRGDTKKTRPNRTCDEYNLFSLDVVNTYSKAFVCKQFQGISAWLWNDNLHSVPISVNENFIFS